MKKMIITLLVSVMIISAIGVSFAAPSPSITYVNVQQPTSIAIDDLYPNQVLTFNAKVNDTIDVKGLLTSGGTGLGNKLIFHDYYSATDNKWYWDYNFTTNADGSFEDQFYFKYPGTHQVKYFFHGDDQFAPSGSNVVKVNVESNSTPGVLNSLGALIVIVFVGLLMFFVGFRLVTRSRKKGPRDIEEPRRRGNGRALGSGDVAPLNYQTETQPQTRPTYAPPTSIPTPISTQLYVPPASVPSLPVELVPQFSQARYLGEGGFARVFSAVNQEGTPVAVKVLKTYDTKAGKLFMTEATNWSILHHENIVSLFNYNIFPIPYLESELCDSSLEQEMNRGTIAIERAIDVVKQIARGLSYAHEQRILHGDIKPSNILFKGNVAKLGDWGLSKLKTEHSVSIAGITLQYAAPEDLSRRFGGADERTDIYQLGVLFYQLVAEKVPFTGEESLIVDAILEDTPTPPSKLRPMAAPLDNIILKCLQKNKEERYQSAEDLLRDLDLVGS
jgi:hypothetical protein